jgi:hypothetical protein
VIWRGKSRKRKREERRQLQDFDVFYCQGYQGSELGRLTLTECTFPFNTPDTSILSISCTAMALLFLSIGGKLPQDYTHTGASVF